MHPSLPHRWHCASQSQAILRMHMLSGSHLGSTAQRGREATHGANDPNNSTPAALPGGAHTPAPKDWARTNASLPSRVDASNTMKKSACVESSQGFGGRPGAARTRASRLLAKLRRLAHSERVRRRAGGQIEASQQILVRSSRSSGLLECASTTNTCQHTPTAVSC